MIVVAKPPPVVIGCPAPRFRRNPGPSPEWLPDPASIQVRDPAHVDAGRPAPAVARNVYPVSVLIEVSEPRVVSVRVLPALGIENGAVAILVPFVPLV